MLAERELETPIGWEWVETYSEPPLPREMQDNNNNNNQRPVQMPRENQTPKQKRKPPRL